MLARQPDPAALGTSRDARCKASEETIREALAGHYLGQTHQVPRSIISPKPLQKPHPPIYTAA